MRIDRGAGCGAAPRRLPGRRSRPPLLSVSPHPRTPLSGGHRTAPLQQPRHTRAPRASRCAPHSVGGAPLRGLSPRVSLVWGPQSPQGTPAGTRGQPRALLSPGVPRVWGLLRALLPVRSARGDVAQSFLLPAGKPFWACWKKKQRTCTAAGTAQLTASQRREGMRVSPQPTFPSQRQIFFFFSGPGVPGACWAPQHLPTPRCPGRRDKNQPCRVTAVPPRWSRARSLSHTAPLISGRRSRGGCPGAQQRPGSLGGGFSLRAGSSCCVPHGWLFPGTPSPRRI